MTPTTWTDVLLELLVTSLVMPHLERVLPDGIPSEVLAAIQPEVQKILTGEPVNLFDLRRLVLSVTDEKLREIGAIG